MAHRCSQENALKSTHLSRLYLIDLVSSSLHPQYGRKGVHLRRPWVGMNQGRRNGRCGCLVQATYGGRPGIRYQEVRGDLMAALEIRLSLAEGGEIAFR